MADETGQPQSDCASTTVDEKSASTSDQDAIGVVRLVKLHRPAISEIGHQALTSRE